MPTVEWFRGSSEKLNRTLMITFIESKNINNWPKGKQLFGIGWYDLKHKIGTQFCRKFDDKGGELAHAFPPKTCSPKLAGECHFDEAETWEQARDNSVVDLHPVAL